MMCGGTDYDNCNDGTDGKVSDEADVDSIFSPNILLFLVEKNQELSRDRKNICNSALWYGDQTATNRSGDRGAVQSNDIINYCYLFIHNSY